MASITTTKSRVGTNDANLSEALEDLSVKHVSICDGPISARDASLLRDLLRCPHRTNEWYLKLSNCHPENDAARRILRSIFPSSFSALNLHRLNYENSGHRQMLACVLGPETDASIHIDVIYFVCCKLDHKVMKLMRSWISGGVRVQKYHVNEFFIYHSESNENYSNNFASFLTSAYGETEVKPKKITLFARETMFEGEDDHGFTEVPGYGDLLYFRRWDGLELRVGGTNATQVRGLYFLELAKSISLFDINGQISLMESRVLQFLRKEYVRCKRFSLWMANSNNIESACIFHALKENDWLEYFEVGWEEENDLSDYPGELLLECLEQNKTLKGLVLGSELLACDTQLLWQIRDILSTTNTSLETFKVPSVTSDGVYFKANGGHEVIGRGNDNTVSWILHHLTFRNKAGRRILLNQSRVPLGLWPVVFGRIRKFTVAKLSYESDESFEEWRCQFPGALRRRADEDISTRCQSDAIYHILREGCSSVFLSCGPTLRKRSSPAAGY